MKSDIVNQCPFCGQAVQKCERCSGQRIEYAEEPTMLYWSHGKCLQATGRQVIQSLILLLPGSPAHGATASESLDDELLRQARKLAKQHNLVLRRSGTVGYNLFVDEMARLMSLRNPLPIGRVSNKPKAILRHASLPQVIAFLQKPGTRAGG